MAESPMIAMLWIGGSLSWLERLCLKSFVDAGQPITLYTYEAVEGVPEGVIVERGQDILDSETFLRHHRNGSVAPFSDKFRFTMLRKRPGQVWVDTDIYAWRPLTPDGPHVFGYEKRNRVNSAVLGLPPDSDALGGMLEFMEEEYPIPPFLHPNLQAEYREAAEAGKPVHVSEMPWGLWGPLGITWFLRQSGEEKFAKPEDVYYPIHYRDRNIFFKRPMKTENALTANTVTIHLWAPIKRFAGSRHGGYAPMGSFLQKLLHKHDIDRMEGRIVSHGNKSFDHTEYDRLQAEAAEASEAAEANAGT